MPPRPPARLAAFASQRSFTATISNTPSLPPIDWAAVGQTAPTLLSSTSTTSLPAADAIVITWAEAEWAAMEHVFCASTSSMAYSARKSSSWSGWNRYAKGLPSGAASGWSFWGEWRLVQIAGSTVMLFKSNTHLDFPGQTDLADMMKLLLKDVEPTLVLSIGTAGGAQTGDAVGTVRASSAATLYEPGEAASEWPVYTDTWSANATVLNQAGFSSLLFSIPTTASDLQSLCTQFNKEYGTSYTLAELNPGNLNSGDPTPRVVNQTGGSASLLTTPTFVVGTTSGSYQAYTSIEMDDAILAQVCDAAGVNFGSVRNISDPVQNAALPAEVQGNWGSLIYETYGLYTSYNGALAAWAVLAAQG